MPARFGDGVLAAASFVFFHFGDAAGDEARFVPSAAFAASLAVAVAMEEGFGGFEGGEGGKGDACTKPAGSDSSATSASAVVDAGALLGFLFDANASKPLR